MSYDIKTKHTHELIKATFEGRLDIDKTKKLFLEIVTVSEQMCDFEIILDIRKAHLTMSVADIWHLASELSKFRKTFTRKTAILCPFEQYEFNQADFFALCSQNRGLDICAFTSSGEAMEWLSGGMTLNKNQESFA